MTSTDGIARYVTIDQDGVPQIRPLRFGNLILEEVKIDDTGTPGLRDTAWFRAACTEDYAKLVREDIFFDEPFELSRAKPIYLGHCILSTHLDCIAFDLGLALSGGPLRFGFPREGKR